MRITQCWPSFCPKCIQSRFKVLTRYTNSSEISLYPRPPSGASCHSIQSSTWHRPSNLRCPERNTCYFPAELPLKGPPSRRAGPPCSQWLVAQPWSHHRYRPLSSYSTTKSCGSCFQKSNPSSSFHPHSHHLVKATSISCQGYYYYNSLLSVVVHMESILTAARVTPHTVACDNHTLSQWVDSILA